MAEIKWIKIATDIFDDEKILLIESMPDSDAIIVIWMKLLVFAGKQNNDGVLIMNNAVPYDAEMLSAIFRRPLNTVRLALSVFERFGMIEVVDDVITIPNWEKHQNLDGMDKIREQTRQRVARHRAKQKQIAECNVTVTQGNAIEQDKDKNKIKNCSSYTDVWKTLTVEQIDCLHDTYEQAGDLIQAVYEQAKLKHKIINDVYAYVVGYAEKKGWQKVGQNNGL